MKILRIQGKNVASLSEFDVSLEDGVLAEAGLFVIEGPTGAGKSTLLDAICLSLYNSTPRLTSKSTADRIEDPGDKKGLSSLDCRSLLRNGTASAYTEVTFLGTDDKKWVARWEVRRARNSPSGRLQQAQISIRDVDNTVQHSDKIKETLRFIEEKVGLSEEQFKRSVILPQGEFANFLKAKANERAELLEKMTGSDIYRRISSTCYLVAKEKRQEIAQKEASLQDIALLSEEEIATHCQSIEALTQETKKTETEKKEGLQKVEELSAHINLFKEEHSLQKSLEEVTALYQEQADQFADLAFWHRIKPLETTFTLWKGFKENEYLLQHESQRLLSSQKEVKSQVAARKAEVAQKAREQDAFYSHKVKSESEKSEAIKLDTEVSSQKEAIAALQAKERQLQDNADQAKQKLTVLSREGTKKQKELEDIKTTLQAPKHKTLLTQGQHVRTECLKLAELITQEKEVKQEGIKLKEELQQKLESRKRVLEQEQEQQQTVKNAETEITTQREKLGKLPPREKTSQLYQQLNQLSQEIEKTKTLVENRENHLTLAGKLSCQLEQYHRSEVKVSQLKNQLTTTQQELKTLETHDLLLKLQSSQEDILHQAENCPLCGSARSHWEADATPQGHAKTKNKSIQIQEKTEQLESLEESYQHHRLGLAQESADIKALRQRLSDLDSKYTELGGKETSLDDLKKQQKTREQNLLVWKEKIRHQEKVEAEKQDIETSIQHRQEQITQKRKLLELSRESLQSLSNETTQLEIAISQNKTNLEHMHRQMKDLSSFLDNAIPMENWKKNLYNDGKKFLSTLDNLLVHLDNQLRQSERLSLDINEIKLTTETTKHTVAEVTAQLQHTQAEIKKAKDSLTSLVQKRKNLLDGKPVLTYEKDLAQTEKKLREELSESQQRATQAIENDLRLTEKIKASEERIHDIQNKLTETARMLTQNLDSTRIQSPSDLVAYFEKQDSYKRLEREKERLEKKQEQLKSKIAEVHQRLPPEKVPIDTLNSELLQQEAHLAQLDKRISESHTKIGRYQQILETDRKQQELFSDKKKAIQHLEEDALPYEKLAELIGSSTGDKFLKFANRITLEALLVHANEHLKQLKPRYRLQRIPSQDMGMQVLDHAMGNEVRSCHTLSGGETFLISLALALALSSISSYHVKIRSLFIDEGFGTLDHKSLDEAIALLDTLQNTGSQVGIISHVPGLSERIGYCIHVTPTSPGKSKVSTAAL